LVDIGLNVRWHHGASYLVLLVDNDGFWGLVVRRNEGSYLALRISVGS